MGAKSFDAATWSKVRVSCPARSAFLLFRDTSRPPGHRERGRACVREGDRPAPARWAAELRTCPELLWLQGDSKMATVPLLANAPGPRGALWVHKGSICVQESKAVAEFILPDLEELPTKTLLRCRKPAFTSSWPSSPGKMREVLAADFPGAGPPGDGAVAGGRPNSLRSIAKGRMLGDARFGTMCRQCCCNLARCGAGMLGLGLSPITPLVPGDCVRWWPPVAQKGRERHPWMGADDEPRAQLRATHAAALAKARAGGGARQPSLLTRQRVGEKINRGPCRRVRSLALLLSDHLSSLLRTVSYAVTLKGRWRAQERPHVPLELLRASGSPETPCAAPRCAALRRAVDAPVRQSRPLQVGEPVELWPGPRRRGAVLAPTGAESGPGALSSGSSQRSMASRHPPRALWRCGAAVRKKATTALLRHYKAPPPHTLCHLFPFLAPFARRCVSSAKKPWPSQRRPRAARRSRSRIEATRPPTSGGASSREAGSSERRPERRLKSVACSTEGRTKRRGRRPGGALRGCSPLLKRESQVLWRSIGVRHAAGSAPGFPTGPL